ncbi:M3 family oligoendopeptidase [soil metagenome]
MPKRARLTPADFAEASWDDVLPYYDRLAEAPLTKRNVKTWLNSWAELEAAVGEAIAVASVAFSANTADPELEASHLRFATEIQPNCAEQFVRLGSRLIELGYGPADLRPTLRNIQNQAELFREENLPLQQALQPLDLEYQRITGEMTAIWEGERVPVAYLGLHMRSPIRAERKRAVVKYCAPYLRQRDELAAIFDRQLELRQQIARNAGFTNYLEYAFREKNRFDYGPAECADFHDAVEQTVVPVLERRYERLRRMLRVKSIRPWDIRADPRNREALRPFQDAHDLAERAEGVFRLVDPVFGDRFARMRAEGLLDLEARENKAPTGFCTSLLASERPLIFMNAVGSAQDVDTLLHEGGHAMHLFEIFEAQPPYLRDWPPMEFTEVGSMAMELLAGPFLSEFYSEPDAKRARIEHFSQMLELFAYIASIDAFQHWLYTDSDAADREARDEAWVRISERFNGGIDWAGFEAEQRIQWYQQILIFTAPLYMMEYAIAQIGALQIWQRSLIDREAAIRDYRRAMALGNTRSLPELFETAGAKFRFDAEKLGELVEVVEAELERLEG